MSDLSPECAPKRTSADRSEFMGSRPSQIKSNAPLPPINPFRVTNAATIQLAAGRPPRSFGADPAALRASYLCAGTDL